MEWEIIDTGANSAEKNMALDREFLNGLSQCDKPILHLYEWESPSATYGHFIDPYALLDKNKVNIHGLQLAKRPTGGGIIFHLTDFAFSVLVPSTYPLFSLNTLENYERINGMVLKAIHHFLGTDQSTLLPIEEARSDKASQHFCMAKPTKFDVMLDGKKIGGAAQRKTKSGYLHQGSISLARPPQNILEDILIDPEVYESMQKNSAFILDGIVIKKDIDETKRQIIGFLLENQL